MTLNGVMTLTLRYFAEFGKPVFQHITASARIELIDQKQYRHVNRRSLRAAKNNERISSLLLLGRSPLNFTWMTKVRNGVETSPKISTG